MNDNCILKSSGISSFKKNFWSGNFLFYSFLIIQLIIYPFFFIPFRNFVVTPCELWASSIGSGYLADILYVFLLLYIGLIIFLWITFLFLWLKTRSLSKFICIIFPIINLSLVIFQVLIWKLFFIYFLFIMSFVLAIMAFILRNIYWKKTKKTIYISSIYIFPIGSLFIGLIFYLLLNVLIPYYTNKTNIIVDFLFIYICAICFYFFFVLFVMRDIQKMIVALNELKDSSES